MLTVHNFTYGLLTPGLAYLLSVLGSFLGLRCTARAQAHAGASRIRWLVLGAVAIGAAGIWVMHFIAMLGYSIPGQQIRFNVPLTVLSMLIAVAVTLVGLFIVSSGGDTTPRLLIGGVITGVGVASMHYMGIAAMRMDATMQFSPVLFIASVVIAVVAATVALWFALRLRNIWSTVGAALIMGVAISGMHYTGMAAMKMYPVAPGTVVATAGASAEGFLLPLILGISILAFVLTALIALSPSEEEIRAEAALTERIAQLERNTGGPRYRG
jgi:NO-binding membrane sensor protein with MHYT domain